MESLHVYTRPTQHLQVGVGFTAKLSNFDDYVGGSVFFIADPQFPMRVKSADKWGPGVNFNINYVHNRYPFVTSFSFPFLGGGSIGIQSSNSFYDEAADPCTFRYVKLREVYRL